MTAMPVMSPAPPGPKGSHLKSLVRAALDPLAFVTSVTARHGEFVMLREGKTYLTTSPDGAQRVLQENHMNYEKGALYRQALRPLMGDGVFIAEGEAWRRQRHIAQPAFSKANHDVFAHVIVRHYAEMQERWMKAARESRPVNLVSETMRLTLQIAFRLTFSDSLDDRKVDELVTAFLACEREMSIARAFYPVHLPAWLPTPSLSRFRRSMNVLEEFVYGEIRSRREKEDSPNDLLGMYMNARFENGEPLGDVAVRDEMLTLLAAGQSVTDAVCWTFPADRPSRRRSTGVGRDAARRRLPTADARRPRVPPLRHDDHPGEPAPLPAGMGLPANSAARRCRVRLQHSGRGADHTVALSDPPAAQALEDPERFDPERFSPERSRGRHRFAWFPFGQGPRKCIGTGLAMLELQLLLPVVYQAFEVEATPGPPIRPVTRISMKQDRALHLTLTPRRGFLEAGE